MAEDYDDDMPALPPATDTDTGTDTQDAAPAPPPGGAPVLEGAPVSLRDRALEGLDPETRSAVILEASDQGIRDRNDSAWMLFRKLRDATDAAISANRAAARIEAATRGVGDQIYQTTVRAATDLKGVIDADIRKNAVDVGRATANAILVSINKGTEKIQEVVADLDKIAEEKGAQFAASWRAQAARAGEEQAKAALQKAIAIRWGVVTMTIIISIVAGAIIATGFADLTGHLLPWKWALITNPQGLSECGLTRGYPHNPMCWVRNY